LVDIINPTSLAGKRYFILSADDKSGSLATWMRDYFLIRLTAGSEEEEIEFLEVVVS